jgi:hypothetical protein
MVAAGCGRDKRPPPRDAAQGCRAAMEAAGQKGHVTLALREALSCERMYRDKDCAAAWTRLGEDSMRPERSLAYIEKTCRRACIRDSGGAPGKGCIAPADRFGDGSVLGRVVELDRAMLAQAGLPPAEAEALAMRTIILASGAQRGSYTFRSIDPPDPDPDTDPDPYPPPPPPPPPPPSSGALIVDVDLATIHVYGEEVALDDLQTKVSSLKSRLGFERAEVQSHPDVPYERLIRVLDAVRAGGIDEVTFSARP